MRTIDVLSSRTIREIQLSNKGFDQSARRFLRLVEGPIPKLPAYGQRSMPSEDRQFHVTSVVVIMLLRYETAVSTQKYLVPRQWLLFLGQLPAAPSSGRVALWRRLRVAGAASVLNGAWILPVTDEHKLLYGQLVEMVRAQGGSATVFATAATSENEEQAIVARFRADRAREYDEFAERSGEFLAEIKKETRRQKFTFAELEEIEDDLDKPSAWLAKIKARDFFPDARMQQANERLETCSTALRTFAEAVYAQEGVVDPAEGCAGLPDPDTPNSSPRKRGGPRNG